MFACQPIYITLNRFPCVTTHAVNRNQAAYSDRRQIYHVYQYRIDTCNLHQKSVAVHLRYLRHTSGKALTSVNMESESARIKYSVVTLHTETPQSTLFCCFVAPCVLQRFCLKFIDHWQFSLFFLTWICMFVHSFSLNGKELALATAEAIFL